MKDLSISFYVTKVSERDSPALETTVRVEKLERGGRERSGQPWMRGKRKHNVWAMPGKRAPRRGHGEERNDPGRKADRSQLPHRKRDGKKQWGDPFPWAWARHSLSPDPPPAFVPWKALKALLSTGQETNASSLGEKLSCNEYRKQRQLFFPPQMRAPPGWDLGTLATR